MKRTLRLFWLGFLSVFGTSKLLDKVEEDIAFITGANNESATPAPSVSQTSETRRA